MPGINLSVPPSAREPKDKDPRAEHAKLIDRLNSLTRGIRGEHGVTPQYLADAVAKHNRILVEFYRPANDHQSWLLSQVADAAARLDHCQISLRAELDDMADRADLCWDEDRKRAAEETASLLSKNPSRTVARLRETPQGCRWILARWKALSVPLVEQTPWNEDQCNLAARLMGVGPDLRPLYPTLNPSANSSDHAALMCEQADAVHCLMVSALEPLDAKARELTRLGYPLRPSKEFLRLQRQESKLRKVYNDAMNAFRAARAESVAISEPLTCLSTEPEFIPLPIVPETDFLPEPDLEFEPEPESEPEPEPESGTDSPPASKPLMAMLAALAESSLPSVPSRVSLTSALPQPTSARSRKARRALEKAARKRHRQANAG